MSKNKKFDYESAMPEEEVSWRMGSSAGRRLRSRLTELGLLDTSTEESPPADVTEA